MSEEETIKSFKLLMYNAKANWDYFTYEILFNFFSLYNNVIEENKKLNEYKENYIPIQKIKDKIEELNKKEKKELKGMKGQDRYFVKQTYQNKQIILQELLDGRNTDVSGIGSED